MRRIAKDAWAAELQEFTNRNAAKRVVVEEDSLELGAQREVSRYALRGVAYDPRDDRIEIMLSDGPTSHLTHGIPAPRGVDLLAGAREGAATLRVEHEGGQTLLHVLPGSLSGGRGSRRSRV